MVSFGSARCTPNTSEAEGRTPWFSMSAVTTAVAMRAIRCLHGRHVVRRVASSRPSATPTTTDGAADLKSGLRLLGWLTVPSVYVHAVRDVRCDSAGDVPFGCDTPFRASAGVVGNDARSRRDWIAGSVGAGRDLDVLSRGVQERADRASLAVVRGVATRVRAALVLRPSFMGRIPASRNAAVVAVVRPMPVFVWSWIVDQSGSTSADSTCSSALRPT